VIARTFLGRSLAVALSLGISQFATPTPAAAAPAASTHMVDSGQVVARLLETARTRDEKVKLFQDALSTPEARSKAKSMGYDPDRLVAAVPHLSDAELADISQRAQNVKDVAAGHHHSDEGLIILGIILLVAAIVIIAAAASDGYYGNCGCY
jgi:hypothetical protein